MKKGKKIVALVAGLVTAALTLLIFYLTINEIVTGIVISWLVGFNGFFIAAILVWCALDLEKIDENTTDGSRYQDWVDKHGDIK